MAKQNSVFVVISFYHRQFSTDTEVTTQFNILWDLGFCTTYEDAHAAATQYLESQVLPEPGVGESPLMLAIRELAPSAAVDVPDKRGVGSDFGELTSDFLNPIVATPAQVPAREAVVGMYARGPNGKIHRPRDPRYTALRHPISTTLSTVGELTAACSVNVYHPAMARLSKKDRRTRGNDCCKRCFKGEYTQPVATSAIVDFSEVAPFM